jgi:hypothetical protein
MTSTAAPSASRLPPRTRNTRLKGATVLCSRGEPFCRSKDEPNRRSCFIFRPPRSPSVRTVSAGLPGQGRRR